MGETTRRFRRRKDDRPLRWWATRLAWFAAGAVATLAYVAVMRLALGPM